MRQLKAFLITFVIIMAVGIAALLLISGSLESSGGSVAADRSASGSGASSSSHALNIEKIPVEENAAGDAMDASDGEEAEAEVAMLALPEGTVAIDGAYGGEIHGAGGNFLVEGDGALVTFAFAGDILFDDYYATGAAVRQRGGIEACFDAGVMEKMQDADVFIVNNEFPYTDRGTPTPGKTYTFRAKPDAAQWLKVMGADLVTLANNHTYDFGETGLLDTLATLREAGIPYLGAGENIAEAANTAYFYLTSDGVEKSSTQIPEDHSMVVAVLNATRIEQDGSPDTRPATETSAGVFRCYDPDRLCEEIRAAKEKADFVIVTVHWGTEKTTQLDWGQEQLMPRIADAGADLIVGAHPHILQRFAYEGEMPIVYSLGNYYFTSFTVDTGLLEVSFSPEEKRMSQLRFVPCLQSGTSVRLLDGAEKQRILDELREMSPGVSIDDDGVISKMY